MSFKGTYVRMQKFAKFVVIIAYNFLEVMQINLNIILCTNGPHVMLFVHQIHSFMLMLRTYVILHT